ncbi:MAG: ABC transporter permease [Candidatus Omnitrophica bacterium]|nr:ABC transporter permease [Candidatus Omnitrophota bacterium]
MIELKNVSKTYYIGSNPVYALKDVSLEIEQGDFVAIMGASGSGKSTMMHILGLLDIPDKGEYFLNGNNVSNLSDDDLAGLRNKAAGFVFQQFHLLQKMTTKDNVALPCIYSTEQKDYSAQVDEKLKSVGLADRAKHRPNELSGGQQQRVAIARALVREPMIIFADEPTGNLDSKSSREIMEILTKLNEQGKTIIMVTHEDDIAGYAKRIIKMFDGQIISDKREKKAPAKSENNVSMNNLIGQRHSAWNRAELAGHFRQALNSIFSNKIRSFLSMLGILIGVASVIAMLALGEGAKSSMQEKLKSLGSNLISIRGGSAKVRGAAKGMGAVTRFTFKDVEKIQALQPYVAQAAGVVTGSGQIVYEHDNWNSTIEGAGYDYAQMRASVPEYGRWFTREEIQLRAKVAIIGTTVVEKLFGNKNPIGETIKINRINFKVIGILPEKGFAGPRDQDDMVNIPITTAMYRVLGKDYLDSIYVEITSPQLIDEGKQKLEQLIRKQHKLYKDDDSFSIHDMTEIQAMLSSTTNTMSVLLGCIAAISMVVGGIGIMNIMLVSVTERTREIGLRKAIGARNLDIMAQFLIEAVVMTMSGGVIGILTGIAIAGILSHAAGWNVTVTMSSIILATSFSIAIGIGFGFWPAKKAAQLNPVEALRYE